MPSRKSISDMERTDWLSETPWKSAVHNCIGVNCQLWFTRWFQMAPWSNQRAQNKLLKNYMKTTKPRPTINSLKCWELKLQKWVSHKYSQVYAFGTQLKNLIFNLCQLLEYFITKNQQIPAQRELLDKLKQEMTIK